MPALVANRAGVTALPVPLASPRRLARALLASPAASLLASLLAAPLLAAALGAQAPAARPDTALRDRHYWRDFTAGAAASLLLHEAAHVGTALALGAHPRLGLDRGRPTVYSGIDPVAEPGKQFLFSGMGLDVQALLDEAILDVPHRRGGAFERGVLAAGVGTALFYVTIGRTGSVSDIDFMSRTSSLSRTDLTLIYGGVALLHAARIRHDGRYAHFFVRPTPRGGQGLRLGVRLE